MKKNALDLTAMILLIVGGLNWLLVIWNINLVTLLFSAVPGLVNIIYALVGLSAIWGIKMLAK